MEMPAFSFNEAVAQNHGSHSDPDVGVGELFASMRPWHRTTDHEAVRRGKDEFDTASMRPWHRTTDHASVSATGLRSRSSFNEAVAQNHGSPKRTTSSPEQKTLLQ